MQSWIGRTVGQVLAECGARFDEMELIDEPPGKLRAAQVDCRRANPPSVLILELHYHPGLFSAERTWSRELVEAQVVTRVHESTRGLR
jgi:hypothetical protein